MFGVRTVIVTRRTRKVNDTNEKSEVEVNPKKMPFSLARILLDTGEYEMVGVGLIKRKAMEEEGEIE